jgi:general nucleoside transport system permease protein
MDNTLIFASIVGLALRSGTSLLYATLGEIITEKSGVLNLGLEGMLLSSAMISFAVAYNTGNVFLAVLFGGLMGSMLAVLFSLATIIFQANQVVSGLSLFILGSGLASFLGQRLGPQGTTLVGLVGPHLPKISIPILSSIPAFGEELFNQDILTYGMYLLPPLLAFLIYRTRLGLNLRAVGENPYTADVLGIKIQKTRIISTVAGGFLVGLGGAHMSLSYAPGWTENLTGGRGWIAIAMVIFSAWNPLRAVIGAMLFGGLSALQFRFQALGTSIPPAYLRMVPYIFTLIVLILINSPIFSKNRLGIPASLGQNYRRESSE